MDELIWRSDAIKAITGEPIDAHYPSWYVDKLKKVPSAEPWDIVKTALKELEQKEERLYSDYCDATASLKAISKIAKSSQTPKQKIDGIKPLAEMEATE